MFLTQQSVLFSVSATPLKLLHRILLNFLVFKTQRVRLDVHDNRKLRFHNFSWKFDHAL